ncbi:MAG: GtrA family protein [Gammaproteobacteria bacterium]|jgi:putative flippase GtrA|nr:GtrA family protein [Gammaproteobacteria bacterium]
MSHNGLHKTWLIPRYLTAGAVGTLVHYAVLILAVSGLKLSPVLGTSLGALLGAIVNYISNYHYTFASGAEHTKALPRFLAMASFGLAINAGIVGVIVRLGFHYLVAQVVATCFVAILTFIVSKTWIFQTSKA